MAKRAEAQNIVEKNVGIEDMVLLQDARDSGIVENLKNRLTAAQIYTYIGPVLIACNPYKWLNIYDERYVKKYKFQSRNDAAPHIFMTAEAAYRGMITEEENQCIIISGESGAGKTEASKQIQNYIAAVSGGGHDVDQLKETFLRSNPVLEAFGNAKTLRNNNSSRFGKYFELKFDRYGAPKGGIITNYLLEKSRIVSPGEGERGFHIFYQLLASQEGRKLGLTSATDYNYLSVSNCSAVDGMDDKAEFKDTLDAMKSVGMNDRQIDSIFMLIAAILNVGNVRFSPIQEGDAEGSVLQKSGAGALQAFANLTKIDADIFLYTITHREMQTMAAGGKTETYQVPQNPVQASTRRDAVAKSLYERMFDLIVARINQALEPEEDGSDDEMLSIGVLDIYGFEIFQNNGFEQLCINYVNEKLQQIFIELTLRAEQDEYEREGIAWQPIPFFNNRIVCDLLDGSQPPGLFRVLDDTCKTLHGSKDTVEVDKKFLEGASKVHSSHAHFSQNGRGFTIKHYAGEVVYTVGRIADSNKDALNKDIVLMIQTTADKLVSHLFSEVVDMNDKKAPPTAGYRIRTQCNDLVTALMECSPHYVRCIKSNDVKQALSTDTKRVQHQVKYLGLSENIKVRRAGYAYRAEYARFLDRFAVLQPSRLQDWKGPDKEGAKEVLKLLKSKMGDALPKEEVQLGRTMVFIRKPETYFGIEQIRERVIAEYVSKIQRAWREFSHRKEFIVLQIAMTKLYNASDRQRRRESIMRPFKGDYMTFLPGRLGVVINDGVRRILSFYSKEEHVMFSDVFVYQVVGTPKAPHWAYAKRILVMTNVAIYLMEYWSPEYKKVVFPKKELPDVILRRRINIGEVKLNSPGPRPAELEMVMMSTQADPILALLIKPVERIKEYYSPSWPEKNSAKQCAQTGKSFGMFEWKKRCKVSGNIFVDAVCDFEQSVPDYGFYQPDRIGDKSIGLASCDQPEDIILHIDKKTEFVGLLATQWKRLRGQRPPVKFSNEISLRCGPEPSISTRPAAQLQFVKMTSAPAPKTIKVTAKLVNTKELVGELDTSSKILRFSVAPGVSLDMAERRRVRQEEKRRIAELQRTRLAEERKQRNAERSVEREKERMIRIAEKKARKVAEKEAKKAGTGAKKGGLPINKDMASMSVAPPPPRPTLRAPPPVVQAARGPPGQAGGPRGPPMMMGGGPRGPPPPPPPPPPRPMGRPPVFTPPPAPVSAAEEDQDDEYAPAPRVPPSRGSMFGANPYNAPPPRPPMARPPPSASPFSPEQSPRDSGSAPNLNRLSFSLPSRGDSPAPPRPPVRPMVPSPRQDDEDDDDEDYTPPPVMSPPRGPPRGPPPRGPPPQQQQQFQPPPMAPRPAFAPQSGAPRPSGSGPPPGALPPGAPPMPRGMPPRPMPSRPPPRPPGQ